MFVSLIIAQFLNTDIYAV